MAGDLLLSAGRVFLRGMGVRAAGRQQYGMHPVMWGASQILGWEQFGGESVPAAAGVVYRLWARRSVGARPGRTVEAVSWGGCEGGHMAGTYRDLMGLAGGGGARHLRLGTCHQYRHLVDEACCRTGGVAGAEPPHKGGPNRPDRTTAVVSS